MKHGWLRLVIGFVVLTHGRALAQDPPTAPAAPAGDTTATPAGAQPSEGDGATDADGDASSDAEETIAEEGEAASEGGAEAAHDGAPSVTFHGAIEAAYAYNVNAPSNRVNAWRWYDTRHDLVGLQGALLAAEWSAGPVTGTVQLQLGVLAELFWDGPRSPEQDLLWRLMQQATTAWQTPYEPLSLEGGVFNVPFGPEYNNAYRNWNWSASNLFALMPYQVAGFRLNYDLGGGLTARAGVYNGWDQIVADNNAGKSVLVSLEYDDPDDEENYVYFNYMVGNERDSGDARGPYARHTVDLYGQWHVAAPLSLRAYLFAGLEPGRDGNDGWFGAALSARVAVHETFSIAARGDAVRTFAGAENLFHADTLALSDLATDRSTLLGSATLTLDYHPVEFVSVRLELRHDRADFPLFFEGAVPRGSIAMPDPEGEDRPTASDQTTITAGLTTWF